jgi:hypothetical protein
MRAWGLVLVTAGCQERAGVPVFHLLPDPPGASHIHLLFVTTSTEAGVRAGCIHPQGGWPGRCPLSEPGAAAPTQARRGGALERRNPLKYFHIHPKIYTRGVYFRAPAESAATAGSAAGRAGTGSKPTCPPTQQPPAPCILHIAGPAINPVQGFRTLRVLHWEFLRL